MKYEYTFSELQNEMSVLENTFPIVRLVDPVACRVVNVVRQDGRLVFSPEAPCYQVWNRKHQCANCISARTLRSGQACTKFECVGNRVFQIICRYVLLENTKLILEMGTDISAFILDGRETPEEIEELKTERAVKKDAKQHQQLSNTEDLCHRRSTGHAGDGPTGHPA